MKIRIVGGPVEGKVEVDTTSTTTFATIMVQIEQLLKKGPLTSQYALHICELVDKKVKPIIAAQPTETPQSVGLSPTGAILMLKSIGPSPHNTPRSSQPDVPQPKQQSVRDRIVALYQAYDPGKISTVDSLLEKFKGKEDAVLKKLVEKYGPEPTATPSQTSASTLQGPPATESAMPSRTPRERVMAIYEAYDPSKVGTVDATLEKFKGKEEAVIKKLVEKYGPEPVAVSHEVSQPVTSVVSTPSVISATPRQRILAIYEAYDPSKVGTVDATLEKFKGKEEAVIKKLVEKYGPEPLGIVTTPPVTKAVEETSNSQTPHRQATPPPEPPVQLEAVVIPPEPTPEPVVAETRNEPVLEPSQSPIMDKETPEPVPQCVATNQTKPPSTRARSKHLDMFAVNELLLKNQLRLIRQRYVLWSQSMFSQKATNLVDKGVWIVEDGVYRLASTIPCVPEQTTDLVAFLSSQSNIVCDEISDAVQQLVVTALCTDAASNWTYSRIPPYQLPNNIVSAKFIRAATDVVKILRNSETSIGVLQGELNTSNAENARMSLLLEKLEAENTSLRSISSTVNQTMEAFQKVSLQNKELEDCLRQLKEELRTNGVELSAAQRELANERKGIPTELEKLLEHRSIRLASIEQELAKCRVKIRAFTRNEEHLKSRIKELESDVTLMEQSRFLVLRNRGTRSVSADRSEQLSAKNRGNSVETRIVVPPLPIRLLSQQPQTARSPASDNRNSIILTDSDAEFAPEETPSPSAVAFSPTLLASEEKEYRELILRNCLLEEELRANEPPTIPCPHCHTPLTLFQDQNGPARTPGKFAFCFSCRRPFSELDVCCMKSPQSTRKKK